MMYLIGSESLRPFSLYIAFYVNPFLLYVQPTEVLIFRDYTSIDEPALTTSFGFMSMRNIAVIVVGAIITGMMYSTMVPKNMDITLDWFVVCISFIPLLIGFCLAIVKPAYGTADSVMISIMRLMIRQMLSKKIDKKPMELHKKHYKKEEEKEKSQILGFPRHLLHVLFSSSSINDDKNGSSSSSSDNVQSIIEHTQEIVCADLDELKSIRMTLHKGDGTIMPNILVQCYLDDELFDTLRTSTEGVIVLHIRPEREGSRTLIITTINQKDDKKQIILLRRRLQFILRRR